MAITGYYMHYEDMYGDNAPQEGAMIKVKGQMRALENAGIICDYWQFKPSKSAVKLALRRLPWTHDAFDWQIPPDIKERDFVYIRKPWCSKDFIAFLSKLRETSLDLKIICEVFTYPYDDEYKSLRNYPLLIKDRIHRKKLRKYVDVVPNCGGRSEVFGISGFPIINGIDLSSIRPRGTSNTKDPLNIVCLATYAKWHGLDRFVAGLALYLDERDHREVHLHLLGDGPSLDHLKGQVRKSCLSDHVHFYGKCGKDRMNIFYDKCSLAVASLGLHRIGIDVASTLKTREYLAKGMPFVYSGEIDVFQDEPVDFCLQVPADESPIDIAEIVRFHDELYARESEEDLIARIRNYAERHVGMDAAMKPVIDYIKENCVDEK